MTGTCRTCKYWGGNPGIRENHVWAECALLCHVASELRFYQWNECIINWQQREGEPLGAGLSRMWWHPTLFCAASILHDLRYDKLQPGESTAEIDHEWWVNARAASDSWAMRRVADFGYCVIRVYGVMR
jgi:hypothetical protein